MILKRIYQRFFKKDDALSNVENDVSRHMRLNCLVVYPNDILEGVSCSIAMETRELVFLDGRKIEAYNLYDRKNGSFQGTGYVIKRNGRFWGALVGSDYIFSCSKRGFRFEKTKEIRIPLKKDDEAEYILLGHLNRKRDGIEIWARKVMKKLLVNDTESCIFEYGDGLPVHKAFCHPPVSDILKN